MRLLHLLLLLTQTPPITFVLNNSEPPQDYSELKNWFLTLGMPKKGWIILIDFHVRLHLPVLNIQREFPDLSQLHGEMFVMIQANNATRAEEVLSRLGHLQAEFVVTLPEKPSDSLMRYGVTFVQLFCNGSFQVYGGARGGANQDPDPITICYHEYVPYTSSVGSDKGIAHKVMDLMGKQLNRTIKYIKLKQGVPTCKKNGHYTNSWQMLYNHSCDAIMGIVAPCLEDLQDFDLGSSYLADSAILIAPKVSCQRLVGLPKIPTIAEIVGFLLTDAAFRKFLLPLLSTGRNLTFKLHLSSLITGTMWMSSLVFIGAFQFEAFNSLVMKRHDCGINSLEEALSQQKNIGIAELLFPEFMETILHSPRLQNLKNKWEFDKDIKSLDPTKCHILRDIQYTYLLPQRYITKRTNPVFKRLEVLKQIPIHLYYYKGYLLQDNISLALNLVAQGGISRKLSGRMAKSGRIEAVYNRNDFRYLHPRPVRPAGIAWVGFAYVGFIGVSAFVFVGEVFVARFMVRLSK